MPSTACAWRESGSVIVPQPQYRSQTRSFPVSAANSTAFSQSLSACARFTWKNDGAETRIENPHSVSVRWLSPQTARMTGPRITFVRAVFSERMTERSPGAALCARETSFSSCGTPRPLTTRMSMLVPSAASRVITWRRRPAWHSSSYGATPHSFAHSRTARTSASLVSVCKRQPSGASTTAWLRAAKQPILTFPRSPATGNAPLLR